MADNELSALERLERELTAATPGAVGGIEAGGVTIHQHAPGVRSVDARRILRRAWWEGVKVAGAGAVLGLFVLGYIVLEVLPARKERLMFDGYVQAVQEIEAETGLRIPDEFLARHGMSRGQQP